MQKLIHQKLTNLIVRKHPGFRSKGLLWAGGRIMTCAVGRSGIGIKRGEGDGITPRGTFRLLSALARSDNTTLRRSNFDLNFIKNTDGWCDAAGDRNYNRPVQLPYAQSHEKLKRDDHLYDIVIVMDFNVESRMSIGGSAIFFHLAHDDYRPTEGCVAISQSDMLWLLPKIGPDTKMTIE